MFKALTAEHFDPVIYEQKSKELHQVYAQIGANMTANIKETAMNLSQADRIEPAEELRSFGRGKKTMHDKHHNKAIDQDFLTKD